MGSATLVHFDPKQKTRLARRARRRRTSLSQEIREAVKIYLEIPVESEPELAALAAAARQATERMLERLDDTLRVVRRTRKSWEKGR